MADTKIKTVDKWKTKKKYKIILPENFGGKDTGIIAFGTDKNIIGRKVLLSLRDINGDKQKQHINLELRINSVEGDKAKTVFDRLVVDRKYILSRVQPGKTVIDQRYDFKVKNAYVISKINVLTVYKIKRSQKHDIILRIPKILKKYENEDFYKFLEYVLAGNVNMAIFKELKKIVPIQRVEIRELKPLNIVEVKEEEKITKPPESEKLEQAYEEEHASSEAESLIEKEVDQQKDENKDKPPEIE